jgi:hypothetical protein
MRNQKTNFHNGVENHKYYKAKKVRVPPSRPTGLLHAAPALAGRVAVPHVQNVGNEIGSNVLCEDFANPALGLGLLESWGLTACGYAAPNGGSRLRRGRPLLLHLRSCATFELRPPAAVAFALRVKCRPFRFVVLGGVRKRARSDGLVN